MVPFLVFLPGQSVYVGIYACLIVRNILSIIDYPVLLILIKQSSPSDSVMGKINGLTASAGAASRTLAPPIAGFLYSAGAEMGCTAIAWWGSSLVALAGALQLWFIRRNRHAWATVYQATPFHYDEVSEHPHDEIVHIIVNDGDGGYDSGCSEDTVLR
jgi:MFS family permease